MYIVEFISHCQKLGEIEVIVSYFYRLSKSNDFYIKCTKNTFVEKIDDEELKETYD